MRTRSRPKSNDPSEMGGYPIAGRHSAVKPCLWLNRSIRGEGSCYKSQFYGIQSHRCIQMTPTLSCNHRCLHCWRQIEHSVPLPAPADWDSPVEIKGSVIAKHLRLISGYGGSDTTDPDALKEAKQPNQVAISLAGEPTLYPYLPELIDEFKRDGMTTFVVTNGTQPDMVARISPTQLYISLNAPDEATYLRVCNPIGNFWQQIRESLEILRGARSRMRTAVRITLIKGLNIFDPEGYGRLLQTCEPDHIEVKAYMHLGFSRKRLSRDAMPDHDDVLAFASKIADEIGYQIADDAPVSRVVLLSRDGRAKRVR